MSKKEIAVFWFRNDLRLEDNCGLYQALAAGQPVLPIYIFEPTDAPSRFDGSAARIRFVLDCLAGIRRRLRDAGADLAVYHGSADDVLETLCDQYQVTGLYANRLYEPHHRRRDRRIKQLLEDRDVTVSFYKDRCILDYDEVLKTGGMPYTVFTPYKNKWLDTMHRKGLPDFPAMDYKDRFFKGADQTAMPTPEDLSAAASPFEIPDSDLDLSMVETYDQTRDTPSLGTSRLGIHLHFGTVSPRKVVRQTIELNQTFVSQLIWRDFFTSILYHFPEVKDLEFRPRFRGFPWRHDEEAFERWCAGQTGYPLVDAGMRELNATGYMHNRTRMVVAGFLTKHLLTDWRWGMRYFAEKLLDYDMALNNGNWQWAAGTGCDASPYFRIFNPTAQAKKFDPKEKYVRRWVPELGSSAYPKPMVDHRLARERALDQFKNMPAATPS